MKKKNVVGIIWKIASIIIVLSMIGFLIIPAFT